MLALRALRLVLRLRHGATTGCELERAAREPHAQCRESPARPGQVEAEERVDGSPPRPRERDAQRSD